ncbi:hypothetical protein GQ53DRAFT_812402 [Thozetella sp. PMI_491]|nr:hypothetical protein GQ53DRAFT_812402 [Thozetella sp. PMI_491]
MSRPIPDINIPNPTGACWSCVERQEEELCDKGLPACAACTRSSRICQGYHARLRWSQRIRKTSRDVLFEIPAPVSILGLPPTEGRLLQHYLKNLSRISLAIDYDGNGYRRLVNFGVNDEALLNALLAVSEAHLDRLQRKSTSRSRVYIQRALKHLHHRFEKPELLRSETTFMAMMVLLNYELCEGNDMWKQHFSATIAWIRACHDSVAIDPFLATLLSMVATNVLLHNPTGSYRQESYLVLEMLSRSWVTGNAVEVMLGGSVGLPQLIIEAGRLQDDVAEARAHPDPSMLKETVIRANELQLRVKSTRFSAGTQPQLSLLAKPKLHSVAYNALMPANIYEDFDVLEAARASAEIFRHALHVDGEPGNNYTGGYIRVS